MYFSNIKPEYRKEIISRIHTWWDKNQQKDEAQWIKESLSKTGILNWSYIMEIAERLIALEGVKSIEFFKERQNVEPSNPRIQILIQKASGAPEIHTTSQHPFNRIFVNSRYSDIL